MSDKIGNLFVIAEEQLIKEKVDISLPKIIDRAIKIRRLLDKHPILGCKILTSCLSPQEMFKLKDVKI